MLTLQGGGPWFCSLDECESLPSLGSNVLNAHVAEWPADADTRASIQADFEEPWGDRRQEIVFIGEKLDHAGLMAEFDQCLLTNSEMKKWEKIMMSAKDKETLHDRLGQAFEGN
jgi:hypothetical protein